MATFVSLFLVFLAARPAFAYNVTGENARWASQPNPGYCCAHIHVQINTFNYSYTRAAIDSGVGKWSSDSYADIYYEELSGNLTAQDEWNSGDNWYGLTSWHASPDWYTGQNHFDWAHVVLNAQKMYSLPTWQQTDVAIHELGHAVGLDHTYGCIGIMEGTSNFCNFTGPQTDDEVGINHLY